MKPFVLALVCALRLCALDLSPVGAPTGGACSVIDQGYYVICYRADWRIPQWVGEHLTPDQFRVPQVKRSGGFRLDSAIPKADQAGASDYRGSGYDIGHQAPAGDFAFSPEAMRATFVFSNAAPQTPQLNRGPWRDLEVAVRALAASEGEVWVFTGPSVGSSTHRLRDHVLIPQAFWKIILLLRADGTHAVWGYDLPNVAALPGYARFVYALGDIEDISGLRFFSALMLSQRDRETAPNLPALNPLPADAAQAETIHKRK